METLRKWKLRNLYGKSPAELDSTLTSSTLFGLQFRFVLSADWAQKCFKDTTKQEAWILLENEKYLSSKLLHQFRLARKLRVWELTRSDFKLTTFSKLQKCPFKSIFTDVDLVKMTHSVQSLTQSSDDKKSLNLDQRESLLLIRNLNRALSKRSTQTTSTKFSLRNSIKQFNLLHSSITFFAMHSS